MVTPDTSYIADRLAIDDLLTAYTRAIDTGEWDRLDAVFTPDARIDYRASGGIEGTYPEVKAWLAKVLPMFPKRQHIIAQREVVVDGDMARVTAYFLNPMIVSRPGTPEQLWEFGGYYHHRLVRTAGGWRSEELVEEIVWKRGAPGAER
jgi:hypothetical protein